MTCTGTLQKVKRVYLQPGAASSDPPEPKLIVQWLHQTRTLLEVKHCTWSKKASCAKSHLSRLESHYYQLQELVQLGDLLLACSGRVHHASHPAPSAACRQTSLKTPLRRFAISSFSVEQSCPAPTSQEAARVGEVGRIVQAGHNSIGQSGMAGKRGKRDEKAAGGEKVELIPDQNSGP